MASIIEITNPLTGAVERVDKLDHTAQEVDDGIAKAFQLSSPNLLDNWYFGDPVDQRQGWVVPPGKTYYIKGSEVGGVTDRYYNATLIRESDTYSYWSINVDGVTRYVPYNDAVRGYTGAGYTIDRWKLDVDGGGGITITDNGIVITSAGTYFGTRVDKLSLYAGKTVTGSVLMTDGTLHRGTIDSVNWQLDVHHTIFSNNDIHMYINKIGADLAQIEIASNRAGAGIKAAKLELGDTQTLAHQDANGVWVLNEIPDYGQELAKCQRYFQLYSAAEKRPALAVDCRPTMRKDPIQGTIAIGGATYYYNNADL